MSQPQWFRPGGGGCPPVSELRSVADPPPSTAAGPVRVHSGPAPTSDPQGRRLDPTAYAWPRWDRIVRTIPNELTTGPFTRARALELGVTSRMLDGSRFVHMFPRVYQVRTLEPSAANWVEAARLALPGNAFPTGITRIQQLGLDYGPSWPIRFVVEGDLHLVLPGIFLHRTKLLPPVDSFGATPPPRSSPTARGHGSSTRSRWATGCSTKCT